jgi:prepilin signal peptidase PulO-like enzyme (type II secretory pathway)
VWYHTCMILLLLILLGLALGSFVNVLVWRTHQGRDWVRGRSKCEHCQHVLGALDLIPVVSWLWLRGKCRYCHAKIKDSSPWVELTVPALFVVSYLFWPGGLYAQDLFEFTLWLVFLTGFVALAAYDFRWKILPDKFVFPLVWLAALQVLILTIWMGDWRLLVGAIGGALVVSGIFYVLFQVSKGAWIGGGDVKLGLALGLLAGGVVQGFLLLFVASVSGLVVSLPLLLKGRATTKTELPFGPFLILGLIIVTLFGTQIVNWYSGLINV